MEITLLELFAKTIMGVVLITGIVGCVYTAYGLFKEEDDEPNE